MKEQLYTYAWKNNEKRATLYGRICQLLTRGAKNSILIKFIDNGEMVCTSGNAIRKVKFRTNPTPYMSEIMRVFANPELGEPYKMVTIKGGCTPGPTELNLDFFKK